MADGRVRALLTLCFANNTRFRFVAECDPRTIIAVMREQHPEIGFSLKGIIKGVGKIAKKVASSKVFALAAKALKSVAPFLGPLAPALAGASLAMGATTKLIAAKSLSAKGRKADAAKLVAAAAKDAAATPPGIASPPTAASPAVHQGAVLDAAHANANRVFTLLLRPA
jgi:hypothetical protein